MKVIKEYFNSERYYCVIWLNTEPQSPNEIFDHLAFEAPL